MRWDEKLCRLDQASSVQLLSCNRASPGQRRHGFLEQPAVG